MIFFKKEKNILQGVFDFSLEKRNVALNWEKRNRLEYISKRLIFRKKNYLNIERVLVEERNNMKSAKVRII
jgi:hypothetical protein